MNTKGLLITIVVLIVAMLAITIVQHDPGDSISDSAGEMIEEGQDGIDNNTTN